MQFEVSALSTDNRMINTTVDARDESDVRQQMAVRGLYAAAIRPARHSLLAVRKAPAQLSLTLFSQEVLALLRAGLSIVECLEALQEKEGNPAHGALLGRLLAALRDGKRYSDALAEQASVFPALYIGIIRSAEGTSDLPAALARYIDYQQRIDHLKNKITSAAIYPSILLGVGGAVSAFLIGYVVPRFAEVYQGAGRSLPWMSQQLLELGQWVTLYGAFLLPLLLLGGGLGLHALRRSIARSGVLPLLAWLPGIGARIHLAQLSRLYLTLGMLLEGGVSIVTAIDTVEGSTAAGIGQRLQAAKAAIQSGLPLSAAFEAHDLVTPISLRLLRVGERSGELGDMLTQSANFYDGEIGRAIDRFMRMFEPLLMAAIGLVIGVIVVLLYLPIFDLAGGLT